MVGALDCDGWFSAAESTAGRGPSGMCEVHGSNVKTNHRELLRHYEIMLEDSRRLIPGIFKSLDHVHTVIGINPRLYVSHRDIFLFCFSYT